MFADLNGVRVRYETAGKKGPRVALLHGWGCSTDLMKPVMDALSSEYRVLSLDFPGHGQSGRPPEPWGVAEYAQCLMELLRYNQFTPCSLVAHSFGGRIAAWLAVNEPDSFEKLVLTGAAGLKKEPDGQILSKRLQYQRKKAAAQKIGSIPGLGRLAERIQENLIQKYGSPDYKALDPEMRKTFNLVIQQDLRDLYAEIRQSTLLIWGENDTETPLWMGREMEKMIPDAGLVVFEGRSHFAYLEEVQRFVTILKSFL